MGVRGELRWSLKPFGGRSHHLISHLLSFRPPGTPPATEFDVPSGRRRTAVPDLEQHFGEVVCTLSRMNLCITSRLTEPFKLAGSRCRARVPSAIWRRHRSVFRGEGKK